VVESGGWREPQKTEGVAADELDCIGQGVAKGFKEAAGVAWKIKGEVTGAGRGYAGEGEILQKYSKLLVVGGLILRGRRCGEFWRSVGDGNRGFSPSGGGCGKAEGKLDVVAVGDHIGAGRAGTEPGGAIDEETGADTPGHGITGGRKGANCGEVLASSAKCACQSPGDGFGSFLKLASGIHQKWGNRADRMFLHAGYESGEVRRRENGIVIDDEEVCEGWKLGEGGLCGKGKATSEAEIFFGGKKFGGDGGVLGS